jgi:Protein of unknown function (DUF2905)
LTDFRLAHNGASQPTSMLPGYTGAMSVPRLLIIFGLALVALGVLWPLISKVGLGRLPGDIVIERENFRLYIPLATSLLVSVVLSLILWGVGR